MIDIAKRLQRRPGTVYSWRHRGQFPEPDAVIGGVAFWWWPDIEHRLFG